MRHNTQQRGIVLYVAIIIASIVTFISFAVSNAAFRQVQLAQVGEKSQYAFYAANSGVECVMYWDTKQDAVEFATSSDAGRKDDGSDLVRDYTADCNNGNDEEWNMPWQTPEQQDGSDNPSQDGEEGYATTTFIINSLGPDDGVDTCAKIAVGKHKIDSSAGGDEKDIKTIVRASGRSNTGECDGAIPDEAVERTVQVTY